MSNPTDCAFFAVSTGEKTLSDPEWDPVKLGHAAASCLARAIARGVYEATPATGDTYPTWRETFGTPAG